MRFAPQRKVNDLGFHYLDHVNSTGLGYDNRLARKSEPMLTKGEVVGMLAAGVVFMLTIIIGYVR